MFAKHPSVFGYCLLFLFALDNAEVVVRVAFDTSFRLHIFPETLDNPIKCTLTSPRGEVTDIPLDYENEDPQISNGKITPLGKNQCGARIHNTASTDAGRWNLTVSNNMESKSEIYRVIGVLWEAPINRTSTAVIGSMMTTILCGPSSILYCDLKDPLGNDVPLNSRTRCGTTIDVVRPTDFGTWTCTVGVSGSISEIHATHTLLIEDPAEEVVISAVQTSFGNLISWRVERIIPAASWCRAFPPNGESIMVAPGLEQEKYVSTGTDLADNKCGLLLNGEFSEKYHGLWRLEMGLTSGRIIGGFIKMPEGTKPGPNATNNVTSVAYTPGPESTWRPSTKSHDHNTQSTTPRISEINVAERNAFTITCQTQYPAGYCWIKGPRGQIITVTDELTVGRCSYTNNSAIFDDHNGIWTCNMAHVNGGHEEHLVTKVNVIEKLYRAVNPEVLTRHGRRAVIACKSVLNSPLQYCRFIRPDGLGLGIAPGMEPIGRYSYEGDGLDFGYCGLAISSVETVDLGEWTCVSRSRFHTWEAENSDTSVLQTPETSTASILGMTFGAIVLVVAVVAALLVRHRRKRARHSDAAMIVEYNN